VMAHNKRILRARGGRVVVGTVTYSASAVRQLATYQPKLDGL
jgi:hypothetical protein